MKDIVLKNVGGEWQQGTTKKLWHFRFVFVTVWRVSFNIPLWPYVKFM